MENKQTKHLSWGAFKVVCRPNGWHKLMTSRPLVEISSKYIISGIWYLQYSLIKLNDLC